MVEPAPSPPSTPNGRSQRTKQRILDAAGQCFAANGFAKTTVERIASEAGVSKGLVYHHFGGKEAILEAVLARTLSDWSSSDRRRQGPEDEEPVPEALARRTRQSIAYARSNPLLRALFQLDPNVLVSAARSSRVKAYVEEFRRSLLATLERGIRSGELRPELDPERTADVLRMVHMALVDHLLHPEWIDVDDALVDQTIAILLHGLAREEP